MTKLEALLWDIAKLLDNTTVIVGTRSWKGEPSWFASTKWHDKIIEHDGSSALGALQSVHDDVVRLANSEVLELESKLAELKAKV